MSLSIAIHLGLYPGHSPTRTDTLPHLAATLTGLSANGSFSGFALVGSEAGLGAAMLDGTPIDAYAWGASLGGTDFGTGPSPSDFSSADTGNPNAPGLLYLRATVGGVFYEASAVIRAAAPVNSTPPVISGDASAIGNSLSATDGIWSGIGQSYSYQWQRDGVDISDANANTYVITNADEDASLTCVVTATSSGGSVAQSSNTILVDTASVPVITGIPTISGFETEGETLTATPATATGSPVPARSWGWFRDGNVIAGATSAQYTLQAADVGSTLHVTQHETNSAGTDTADSAGTGTIAAAVTSAPLISNISFQSSGISFHVDEAGTLKRIWSHSDTAPTQGQIEAGQDHTGQPATLAPDDVILVNGLNTFSETTASFETGTYYGFFFIEAADGGQSDVEPTGALLVSSPIVTRQGAFDAYFGPSNAGPAESRTDTVDVGPAATGRRIYVGLTYVGGDATPTLTVAGAPATRLSVISTPVFSASAAFFYIDSDTIGGPVDLVLTSSNLREVAGRVWSSTGHGAAPTASETYSNYDGAGSASVTLAPQSGDAILATALSANSSPATWMGVTEIDNTEIRSGEFYASADDLNTEDVGALTVSASSAQEQLLMLLHIT